MKRHRFAFLSILILLSACTGEPAPPPAETRTLIPTETRVPPTATPASTEPGVAVPPIPLTPADISGLEIEFWHVWAGLRGDLIDGLVADFNAENDFGLVARAVYQRDLDAALTRAADLPDIAVGFSYHQAAWGERLSLVDLAPYLNDPVWGLNPADRADLTPIFFPPAGPDGEQFGLPFFRTAEVLLYNRTWAGELGFSAPPGTPEDLAVQLCAANAALRTDTDPANDGDGGLLLGFEAPALVAWMTAFGGTLEAGEGAYGFERAENAAAFTYLRDLLDRNCAWTPTGQYPHDEFAGRRGLVMASTLAGLGPQAEAMAAAGNNDSWEVLSYPTPDGAGSVLFSGPDLILFSGSEAGQLAAWVFAAWLSSPEAQARWTEGTGYFPVRLSVLEEHAGGLPGGADWLPIAAPFHPPGSWTAVQWVLNDFAQVLFAPLTTTADIPDLLVELDAFAEEVDGFR